MMSYIEIYESYCRFCKVVDSKPMSFEDWMVNRDAPPKPQDSQASQYLERQK